MLHFHHRANGSKLVKNNASETNKSKSSNSRRNRLKRRTANNNNSTRSKNKKSTTHNQALKKPCWCSGHPPIYGNEAIMAASNTTSGVTIVINVMGRYFLLYDYFSFLCWIYSCFYWMSIILNFKYKFYYIPRNVNLLTSGQVTLGSLVAMVQGWRDIHDSHPSFKLSFKFIYSRVNM